MIIESNNFLELNDNLVAKIFSSSKLQIDLELEVLYAVVLWLNHNIKERLKFSKDLFLMIRFPLLSDHALKYLFNKSSPFYSTDDCVRIVNEVLQIKKTMFKNKSNSLCNTNRYCSQKNFSTFLCGGCEYAEYSLPNKNLNEKTYKIEMKSLKCIEVLPPMKIKRTRSHAVCIKGEVYVYSGFDINLKVVKSIEKYSPSTNTWKNIGKTYDDRLLFCSCSFATKIFIIGGYLRRRNVEDSCVQFDTRNKKWRQISPLNEDRLYAACAVFEGKVVVSGGYNTTHGVQGLMDTVEAYDYFSDEWSYMPDMIERRFDHESVAIGNKLFVLGGAQGDGHHLNSIEVFDSTCKKFTSLKPLSSNYLITRKTFAFGSEILSYGEKIVLAYDVEKNEWLEKSCQVLEHFNCLSFAKVPDLKLNI